MEKWEHLQISFAQIKDATNNFGKTIGKGVGASTVISDACGTPPYVDPEYIETRFVTKKSDVFSFGMVLFEVLCGRLSLVKDADGILLSADLAKEYYVNGKLDSIIDPVLREQMSPESFKNYSAIAYKCLQDRKHRPLMGVVKKELEVTLKLQPHAFIEVSATKKKSFNARFNIQDDAPGSSSGCVKRNSNDDDVQITVDQNRHVLEESKLDNSPKPVGRLDRKKADATHDFKGLELNNQNNDSAAVWAVFETRFDKLTKFTNGLLPRSLFGECIGINKDSKEFAGKLFDSLSRQRNITVGAISKAQLKDFWDQIADQSYVSRVDNDVDQRITEDQVREIEDLEMLLVQGGRDEVIKERQNLSTNLSQPLKMTHHRSPMRRWYEDLKNRKFK
ncbi:hypothetical protein L1987_48035 [Smallanthus sonchifolius]|uniref:Uncharacterized protein n=1 Tax=Smallanthus sonchifolius TaxID=185202 RepID=A0ACB9FQW2_9ASTR|nr:hypothetical protein L1987_48035 [Smallanthus sonchifolius]